MSQVFTPTGVTKPVIFNRTQFGDDDGLGGIGLARGWVEGRITGIHWQTSGAGPSTTATIISQAALPDLRNALDDVIDDIVENDGGSIADIDIGLTGQKIIRATSVGVSPPRYTWGVYGSVDVDQLRALRDITQAILDL